jgi:hypothetical protein
MSSDYYTPPGSKYWIVRLAQKWSDYWFEKLKASGGGKWWQ